MKALRKLEKVHKDKGSKSFLAEEDDFRGGAEVFQSSEQETEHDIENYVYMMEGDMDQIFDEEGLQEALAERDTLVAKFPLEEEATEVACSSTREAKCTSKASSFAPDVRNAEWWDTGPRSTPIHRMTMLGASRSRSSAGGKM